MIPVRTYRVLDRDYPHLLRDLGSPPDPLCVRGELLGGPAVAIVGTRKATAKALSFAHDLASRMASRGVTVWSGGAVGIDAAAHRGALDAGGVSVAVVPTGFDHCYPKEHRGLYDEIVDKGGAIISPFQVDQQPTFPAFHHRNAVLAALTMATVVVEAPIKSGARSTAAAARRLRRPLFVVPYAPWQTEGEGNVLELRRRGTTVFDEAILCRLLGVPGGHAGPAGARAAGEGSTAGAGTNEVLAGLSPACSVVFYAASTTPRHTDDLCSKTGLAAALVQEALLTLTLQAVLVEGPSGWFRRLS